MGAAAAGLGVSIGTSAIGSLLGGFGDKAAEDAKVKVDQMNAQLASQKAADALQLGAYQAGALRMRGSQLIGKERAGYASSGIDENTGTAAQVQAQTRMMSDLDAKMTMNNAAREAWGYGVNAKQDQLQEQIDQDAGNKGLAGSLLGTVGGLGGGIAGGFKSGVF